MRIRFSAKIIAVLAMLAIVASVLVVGFVQGVQSARRVGKRAMCVSRLKTIAVALDAYYSLHRAFPPANTIDRAGRPMHSWRVLILPQLGYESLYSQINFAEPWNSATNRRVAGLMPDCYRCPADTIAGRTTTNYVAVVGPRAAWQGKNGGAGFVKFTADSNPTILLVETVNSNIDWMEPRDLTFEQAAAGVNVAAKPCIGSHHNDGANYVSVDLWTRWLSSDTSPDMLSALLTIGGKK